MQLFIFGHVTFIQFKIQGYRGYGDSHRYGCEMGMGTMMIPHGSVGIPWGLSNGFQITWKRVKYSYKYNANSIDNYKMTNNNHGLAKL